MTEEVAENRKKFLELASQAWSFTWKTFPVWTIIAGILLWRYLSHIGRLDLFLPSLSNPQGLAAFLIGFVFMCLAVVFALAAPSLYFLTTFTAVTDDFGPGARGAFLRLYGWLVLGALLVMALSVSRWKAFGYLTAAAAVGPSLDLLIRPGDAQLGEKLKIFLGGKGLFSNLGRAMLYVFIGLAGGVLALIPQLLVWPNIPLTTEEWWWQVAFTLLGAIGVAVTLLPALGYHRAKAANKSWAWSFGAFVAVLTSIAFLFFFELAPPAGARLMEAVAKDIGLRSNGVHTYRIKTERFLSDDFDTALWSVRKSSSNYTIEANAPFIFGEVFLLCPQRLDTPEKLREKSAGQCVVFKKDEVSPLPGKTQDASEAHK